MYSELISTTIAGGGQFISNSSFVKLLRQRLFLLFQIQPFEPCKLISFFFFPSPLGSRSVKRETLKLIETSLDEAANWNNSLYKAVMIEDVPLIFGAVFQCTLKMITKNFEDHPEHRLKFFSLLRAIAAHCFPALIGLSSQQIKLVMDSIIWAFRHTEQNIAETGLNLLLAILKNFQFCNQFYRTYYLTIEQEIFAVLTDTFHKSGFKLHVLVLQHLFCLVERGALTEPLGDSSSSTVPHPYPNNAMFVSEYTIKLLGTSFPNLSPAEQRLVTQSVNGLFESRNDLSTFKNHIRDFLVQSKESSAQVRCCIHIFSLTI
ncbi:hypothetical protein CRG98_008939 [Punica granatum]|uniref:Exportin-1 C-terminal domain-containing protein n=2 Tax=Punica granatum TaxID=22663 RepID=A0A2I0KS79_PUNGR|nr:hypothetical protein CRG98_008939 [Punica granatum]